MGRARTHKAMGHDKVLVFYSLMKTHLMVEITGYCGLL